MKNIFLLFALSILVLNNSYGLYALSAGGGCLEIYTFDPCDGGSYLGLACPAGVILTNDDLVQEKITLTKPTEVKSIEKVVILSIDEDSDLAKGILIFDSEIDLSQVKVKVLQDEKAELKATLVKQKMGLMSANASGEVISYSKKRKDKKLCKKECKNLPH